MRQPWQTRIHRVPLWNCAICNRWSEAEFTPQARGLRRRERIWTAAIDECKAASGGRVAGAERELTALKAKLQVEQSAFDQTRDVLSAAYRDVGRGEQVKPGLIVGLELKQKTREVKIRDLLNEITESEERLSVLVRQESEREHWRTLAAVENEYQQRAGEIAFAGRRQGRRAHLVYPIR